MKGPEGETRKLPGGQEARVDQRKIVDYLLCAQHPDGAGKAAFFRHFGFEVHEWSVLADALRRHGRSNPILQMVDSPYGRRYTVKGPLETPCGRRPCVITVWIIEKASTVPRLITAYPGEADDD
jgi:hypothetical protein